MPFKYKNPNGIPIYDWTNKTMEDGAFVQTNAVASLPFAFRHVAMMPDCHQGYGCPIGTVFASKDVIVPNMVGVDISCGVAYTQTNVDVSSVSTEDIKKIIGLWRKNIPVGFNVHKEQMYDIPAHLTSVLNERDRCSIGTLGSGNHFCELTGNSEGKLCILLHSGSRNFGARICKEYNEIAKKENNLWYSKVDPSFDLAFLPAHSCAGEDYIHFMNLAMDFAQLNRDMMLDTTFNSVRGVFPEALQVDRLNCHHNYAALEHHYGENVWIHRKGAIRVRKGEPGIIPGSMGTPSYIVSGLGNPESFCSASHGAGRKMSRTEANNTITEEEANKSIEGIVFGRWSMDKRSKKLDVSESPGAYKVIEEVMANQTDLVEIVTKLTPMGCVKG